MMSDAQTTDFAADAIDAARSMLPIYVVADSPDGDVLSHENGYPGDDTKVWLAKGGSDDDTTTMGDLYAEYGDDLIAYAEPEEAGVAAAMAPALADGLISRETLRSEMGLADLTPDEQAAFGQVKADRAVAELVAAAVHDPTDENMAAAVAALEGAADEWLTAKQDNGQPVTASMVMEELIGDADGLSTLKGWDLTPTTTSNSPGYLDPPPGFPTAEATLDRLEQGLIDQATADRLLTPLTPPVVVLPGGMATATLPAGTPAVTAAMGHQAIDRLEDFLGFAEDKLGITAAMHGPGIISRQTARMAVGENPDAQAEVVAAFEANYTPDQNEFVTTVLGPPPAPNADHDEAAYEALAREARLWHARRTAATVNPPA